ncbi:hypothetical protein F5141DRAFT_1252027 [Pisolithus sp. B1]|nr:hypothetical protein F5141DRAFT_1252027 [Pisolithus sp. B1]
MPIKHANIVVSPINTGHPASAYEALIHTDIIPITAKITSTSIIHTESLLFTYAATPTHTHMGTALVDSGWPDATEKEGLTENLTWAEATQRAIGANNASERTLVAHIKTVCRFPDQSESTRIISGFHWIGLLSSEQVKPRGKNLLDTLCAQLQTLMKYETGKHDLIMLQHKFIMEWWDGTQQILTSTLEKHGRSGGHFAMAVTVSVPCGIAAQQVLDSIINILEFLRHT